LEAARDYLAYLYSPEAQELAAQYHYRPHDKIIANKYKDRFPNLALLTIKDFGGWQVVQKRHFADGGVFDGLTEK
jgi:ABC-type sulfate transport system substrate-binding protein